MKFSFEVAKHKLIYILGAPDDAHRGLLKIGETIITTKIPAKNLTPNCPELNRAAVARIRQYMPTAGVPYKLLHTELAVDDKNEAFRDHDVHDVLTKSGIERVCIGNGQEWFRTDLKIARRALDAVKHGKKFLAGIRPKDIREEIIFRPEQETAIARTVAYFKNGGDRFLWNAKMRFGKTLCALEVVKRMNFAKTIIVTHRPVVKAGWFEDFDKILGGDENFICARDAKDETLAALKKARKNFVCFASIQDLRGSETVGGKFDKNHEVFKVQWDFVIVDEAHEGTTTAIGDNVIKALVKRKTKFLALSGTPFNIRDDYDDDNVFTWDYVMEQRAKKRWAELHPLDHNPYADLPAMNILTYDLGELSKYVDAQDMSFSFREFFRTDENGERFVHEQDVVSFLNLLTLKGDSNYPFSTPEFCDMFKHTLWIVPGVKEGRALSALLKSHQVFCNFEIANVAGDGDEEIKYTDALKLVKATIAANDYTITLSCGKLTTGVTVPEWTAVLYLAGGYMTRASTYLQTIFRVQTPCNKYGVSKQNAYVFDFAPDRALRVVADSVKASTRAGMTTDDQRRALGELLNFCPVIAVKGSEMKDFDTAAKLLKRIKRVQAERIVNKGFEDTSLYNDSLRELSPADLEKFAALKKIVGATKSSKNAGEITINAQGLTDELREDDDTPKSRKPRTDAEKEAARKAAVKSNAIKILHGVSIRMPMLIYGANVPFDEDITIEKFLDIVDDASWVEFMPKGVTKDFFRPFVKYYDPENFVNAGNIVRERAKKADSLTPTERVNAIADLFATFKNPDKETVLTPWNVVKLHIDSVFDEKFFTPDKKILEINSKTGLYPLYVAYKIYRTRLGERNEDNTPLKELRRLWDLSVANNVFALCKTPMAVTITRRTLIGYRRAVAHARHFDKLIDTLKTKPQDFFKRVTNAQFWDKGVGTMFFDAVVGNPPYQTTGSGDNKTFAAPVYHEFLKAAYNDKLTKRASLIHPARILSGAGAIPGDFPEKFIADTHVRLVKHFLRSQDAFPTSDIKGGVAITEFDATKTFEPIGLYIPFDELIAIHEKVVVNNPNFKPLSEIVFGRTNYRLTEKFIEDHPDAPFLERKNDFLKSNAFEYAANYFFDNKPDDGNDYYQIYGLLNNKRFFKWIRREYIIPSDENKNFDKFKIFVPKSNGSGAFGESLSNPIVGKPLVGCTQTFITVGAFDSRAETETCLTYIKTKFVRAMLGILKVTQDNPSQTWSKVPLQDFTSASDIDWSLSIPEIDEKLYDKYGLTDAERDFIESHVKAMT